MTRVLLAACLVFAQAPADSSPHTTRMVPVDEGVQLEVLDWGGSGPALVLLAGLGATAHHYDDIAPALTAEYRVVGITRRGHQGSSAPTSGYGFARLADDVLRVIEAVGVTNPVVIGHSFAGEEMHVLGSRHALKIKGLIYIDAAFDRGDDADTVAFNAVAKTVPTAPRPNAPTWVPELSVRQAMMKEIQAAYQPYKPERIRVPALALYAVPKSADDLMRRGSSDRAAFPELAARTADDPALRERVEQLFQMTRARVRKHAKWFEAFAERGRVVELSGTHGLAISNRREVLEQIDAFVLSLEK